MTKKRPAIQPTSYYHVVTRGNYRNNIFRSPADMRALLHAFLHVHQKHPFKVIAFCFMTNHYHLLIQTPDENLPKIMGMVNRRYAEYYRRKYRLVGRTYQKPYWSKEVKGSRALLDVSAYIHRNPIQTKIPMAGKLETYAFSSFPCYVNESKMNHTFLDLTHLPQLFKSTKPDHFQRYVRYVKSKEFFAEEDEYVGEEEGDFSILENETGLFQKMLINGIV